MGDGFSQGCVFSASQNQVRASVDLPTDSGEEPRIEPADALGQLSLGENPTVLEMSGVTVDLDVRVTLPFDGSALSVAGTFSFGAASATLLPGADSAVTASVGGLTGTIDLGTGAVHVDAASLDVTIRNSAADDLVRLNAMDIDIDFDPADNDPAAVLATIGSATLTLPQLARFRFG